MFRNRPILKAIVFCAAQFVFTIECLAAAVMDDQVAAASLYQTDEPNLVDDLPLPIETPSSVESGAGDSSGVDELPIEVIPPSPSPTPSPSAGPESGTEGTEDPDESSPTSNVEVEPYFPSPSPTPLPELEPGTGESSSVDELPIDVLPPSPSPTPSPSAGPESGTEGTDDPGESGGSGSEGCVGEFCTDPTEPPPAANVEAGAADYSWDNDLLVTNDNCPFTDNDDQSDLDGDGIGDVCDFFNDGSSLPDFPKENSDESTVSCVEDECSSEDSSVPPPVFAFGMYTRPDGTKTSVFVAEDPDFSPRWAIFEAAGSALGKKIGRFFGQEGEFQMTDGTQGNMFESRFLRLTLTARVRSAVDDFRALLRREAAVAGFEIPSIREWLKTNMGILDGKGTRVELIEWANYSHISAHGAAVRDVVRGGIRGIAKDAAVTVSNVHRGVPYLPSSFSPLGPMPAPAMPDRQSDLDKFIDELSVQILIPVSVKLESLLQSGELPDVINMSLGASKSSIYESIYMVLTRNFLSGSTRVYSFPNLRQRVLGVNANILSNAGVTRRIAAYVDARLNDPSGAFQAELDRYRLAVRGLAQQGVTIVVASGNEGMTLPIEFGKPYLIESVRNTLCMAADLICVAASNSNRTPGLGNRGDDTIAAFSSAGSDPYPITLAAPGEHVLATNEVNAGTSFAAPYVAGTVAMMRKVNPSLTVEQIRGLLTMAAVDTAAPPSSEGAGIIEPELAISRARELTSP